MAVMLFAPMTAAVLVHVATAATTARLTQPAMLTPPSWKVTVPVGVPAAGAVAVTRAVEGAPHPDHRRVDRRGHHGGGAALAHRLGQVGRGAGVEVGVTAVDGADRVGPGRGVGD